MLVTHADGTQEVVEVKNDLGLRAGDKAGLAAQGVGVGAAGIDEKGSAGDQVRAVAGAAPPGRGAGAGVGAGVGLGIAGTASRPGSRAASKQPTPRSTASAPPAPLSLARFAAPGPTDAEITHPLLDLLREKLVARGAKGLIGLQRAFRIMDDDGRSVALSLFSPSLSPPSLLFVFVTRWREDTTTNDPTTEVGVSLTRAGAGPSWCAIGCLLPLVCGATAEQRQSAYARLA